MVRKILDRDVVRDMTEEEIAFAEAELAKSVEEQNAKDAAEAQKATDKTNGKQKLLDLGLTQAEVDALT